MLIHVSSAKDLPQWRDALAAALPEAEVAIWQPGLPPVADYAVVWKPPAALFAGQARLKAVFSLGAGVNALLADPALPQDLPLVRMEDGGMAPQMVEYALYAALSLLRRFPGYGRDQAQARWAPHPLRRRQDFTVGVLGLGVLGGTVAQALAGFGFRTLGWSQGAKALAGVECHHGAAGLEAVLAQSQLLVVLLPLTESTRGLLNAERLGRLPAGAGLVNLARGELIDDAALLAALDAGRLGHAFLDVFATEPLPPEHAYWRHPAVTVTPHVAALTPFAEAAEQIADKIRRWQAGEPVGGIVDRTRGY